MDASPARTPLARWGSLVAGTLRASTADRVSLAAAGCAFYATLALFPAISMLISVYGMVLKPVTAEQQLAALSGLLPGPAFDLIAARVHHLVRQTHHALSLNLSVSFLLTLWSASTGSKSVLSAVNIAYDARDRRPFLRFQAIGLSMTLLSVLCAVLAIAVLVVLPPAIGFIGLSRYARALAHGAGTGMLVGFFFLAITLLYRYGPTGPRPGRRRTRPGALLATVVWLVASEFLSFYVSRIGSFGATYGPLGAVVGVMLWFYVSAYAVLVGAEFNARLGDVAACWSRV